MHEKKEVVFGFVGNLRVLSKEKENETAGQLQTAWVAAKKR